MRTLSIGACLMMEGFPNKALEGLTEQHDGFI